MNVKRKKKMCGETGELVEREIIQASSLMIGLYE